jgi:myo-inositol-1(or 4)-monophosphatase
MPPSLQYIESLARQAGEVIRSGYNQRPGFGSVLQVQSKGTVDIVSEIDFQVEKLVLDAIRENFPGDSIVTEESGVLEDKDCCLWYLDPLDGTINYVHGLPFFCVSLAYAEAGEMKLGVVYDPIRDECFIAEHGKGATLNGEPIRVSTTTALIESLLVTGFSYDIRDTDENNLDKFARLSMRARSIRRLGSAALDLCYVAAGRLDGYWELDIHPWDFAAGALIAKEAGAEVTDIKGEVDLLTASHTLLVCTPGIKKEMREVLGI